ncbi:baseplate complex protein [Cedecea sp. MMO-103]|uniref:baseplate complex protein n=1 Tax=Cedecea sp. MMO-103 TaxID=3081238 RepID=UPI00301A12A7
MTSIPTLALNGEAILLKNMRVTITQQFQDKDQSGQTSSTAKSEQGMKGKELRVSGEVPYKSPEILRRIFELSSATESSGERKKYRVAHEVARAVNFREATFTGTLDAPQQDGKMTWLVTFTLTEHVSVQEKREARATGKTTAKKQSAGAAGSGKDAGEDEEKMTWFEKKVLKPVNDALG